MPKDWKTENGYRPDLAALPVNTPIGFIGENFYPAENKIEKTGDTSYVELVADSAAQTDYKDGDAPAATLIATKETAWSLTRCIKRYGVPKKEVYSIGNVAKADELGGKAAKRSVMRAIEATQLTKVFSGEGTSIANGGIITGIQSALSAIRLYEGEKVLACSFATYNKIINSAEIAARMSFNGWLGETDSVLGLKPEVLKSMLSNVFGISRVLIGDDTLTPADKLVVAALPSAEELNYKLTPELGRTFKFMPDGSELFDMESFADEKTKTNYYDAESFYGVVEFNAGARKVLNFTSAAAE